MIARKMSGNALYSSAKILMNGPLLSFCFIEVSPTRYEQVRTNRGPRTLHLFHPVHLNL